MQRCLRRRGSGINECGKEKVQSKSAGRYPGNHHAVSYTHLDVYKRQHEVNVDNPKELAHIIYDFWKGFR